MALEMGPFHLKSRSHLRIKRQDSQRDAHEWLAVKSRFPKVSTPQTRESIPEDKSLHASHVSLHAPSKQLPKLRRQKSKTIPLNGAAWPRLPLRKKAKYAIRVDSMANVDRHASKVRAT